MNKITSIKPRKVNVAPELHTTSEDGNSLHRTLQELETQIRGFQAANLKLSDEKQHLEEKIQGLAGSLRESEGQVKALHKIIIDSGLESPGPLDDDVVLSFDQLFFRIRQFVGKYCRGYRLYSQLFLPNVSLFGFTAEWDSCLGHLEEELSHGGNVPAADIRKWRASTLKLAQLHDPELKYACTALNEMCGNISSEIFQDEWRNEDNPDTRYQEIQAAMTDICKQAYRLAFLLRQSKVDYTWLQAKDPGSLTTDETEVVGSEGGKGLETSAKIVFGGVLKGPGPCEENADGVLLLRKNDILLGPF
ncbi:hypothetical protein AAWM_03635 [Aspergillus awamori]|uniref:Uncharacterized protein n=1 Tax=Aspergillus awamori TaxID=105351 RepID=A0A401KN98_ASPAW|nr:hypothetical protein AAWM_03635 [Aspergillus awamori]